MQKPCQNQNQDVIEVKEPCAVLCILTKTAINACQCIQCDRRRVLETMHTPKQESEVIFTEDDIPF